MMPSAWHIGDAARRAPSQRERVRWQPSKWSATPRRASQYQSGYHRPCSKVASTAVGYGPATARVGSVLRSATNVPPRCLGPGRPAAWPFPTISRLRVNRPELPQRHETGLPPRIGPPRWKSSVETDAPFFRDNVTVSVLRNRVCGQRALESRGTQRSSFGIKMYKPLRAPYRPPRRWAESGRPRLSTKGGHQECQP